MEAETEAQDTAQLVYAASQCDYFLFFALSSHPSNIKPPLHLSLRLGIVVTTVRLRDGV